MRGKEQVLKHKPTQKDLAVVISNDHCSAKLVAVALRPDTPKAMAGQSYCRLFEPHCLLPYQSVPGNLQTGSTDVTSVHSITTMLLNTISCP